MTPRTDIRFKWFLTIINCKDKVTNGTAKLGQESFILQRNNVVVHRVYLERCTNVLEPFTNPLDWHLTMLQQSRVIYRGIPTNYSVKIFGFIFILPEVFPVRFRVCYRNHLDGLSSDSLVFFDRD